ncbi:MAG: hypothetical protein JJ850_03805 [Kordiimonadaceae bacterium]|nr:hypothetical protein [Kordiimonadaceae bacterium]MBO6568558.1 hypothetical protein [Kordiimonadaceae bacterium]MBO6963713.1 hypothetical protein [Kordiimonadaceae bacterium]
MQFSSVTGLAFAWLFLLFAAMIVSVSAVSAQDAGEMPEEGKLAIDMEPFDFPMFNRGRMVGKVSMTLTLVVQEQRDSEDVRLHLPQIRSDFLGALTTLSRQRFNVNKPIDPEIVRAYLTQFLDYRLGEHKADVYVKQALIKPS